MVVTDEGLAPVILEEGGRIPFEMFVFSFPALDTELLVQGRTMISPRGTARHIWWRERTGHMDIPKSSRIAEMDIAQLLEEGTARDPWVKESLKGSYMDVPQHFGTAEAQANNSLESSRHGAWSRWRRFYCIAPGNARMNRRLAALVSGLVVGSRVLRLSTG